MAAGARRALRSPWLILWEVAGVAAAALASTFVEQHPAPAARARLEAESPALAAFVRATGLDHVFTTWWFAAVVLLACASLAVVVADTWPRALLRWRAPGAEGFRAAPFRAEFVRPARGAAGIRVTTRGRAAQLGSPLFHAGLLVVALAGVVRAFAGGAAVVDLFEGETLPPSADAYAAQFPGLLGHRVALAGPLRVETIHPELHPSGKLKQLTARVFQPGPRGDATADVSINRPLDVGAERVYVMPFFGPAAFLEIEQGGAVTRSAVFFGQEELGSFVRVERLSDGTELRMRAASASGDAPRGIELRIVRRRALLAIERLGDGATVSAPGIRVTLHGVRWWVRLQVARDPSVWPAYAGFVLAGLGVVLMFALVRTDTLVAVEPLDADRERVAVALRADRLAPLYADRFRALVRSEGGDPDGRLESRDD